MEILFFAFILLHAIIHFIGTIKAFRPHRIPQFTQPVPRQLGILWGVAAAILVGASALYLINVDTWWMPALAGVMLSQALIIIHFRDAKWGSLANILLLIVLLPAFGHWQMNRLALQHMDALKPHHNQKDRVLRAGDIAHLPAPVQKWIAASGALDRPITRAVRLKQEGKMRTSPNEAWMPFTARQWFDVDEPAFLWRAHVQMAPLVYIEGLDRFLDGQGQMIIRLLSLFTVANASGPSTDQGTMLRYLAETIWFPSAVASQYLRWEPIDENRARAIMRYSGKEVSGVFEFGDDGHLRSFEAMRYYDRKGGATLEPWRIEVLPGGNRAVDDVIIAADAKVIWKLDQGNYHWLTLHIKEIEYF